MHHRLTFSLCFVIWFIFWHLICIFLFFFHVLPRFPRSVTAALMYPFYDPGRLRVSMPLPSYFSLFFFCHRHLAILSFALFGVGGRFFFVPPWPRPRPWPQPWLCVGRFPHPGGGKTKCTPLTITFFLFYGMHDVVLVDSCTWCARNALGTPVHWPATPTCTQWFVSVCE